MTTTDLASHRVAKTIRQLRVYRGLRVKDLQEVLGVSSGQATKLTRSGQLNPDQLEAIAQALDVDTPVLLLSPADALTWVESGPDGPGGGRLPTYYEDIDAGQGVVIPFRRVGTEGVAA